MRSPGDMLNASKGKKSHSGTLCCFQRPSILISITGTTTLAHVANVTACDVGLLISTVTTAPLSVSGYVDCRVVTISPVGTKATELVHAAEIAVREHKRIVLRIIEGVMVA